MVQGMIFQFEMQRIPEGKRLHPCILDVSSQPIPRIFEPTAIQRESIDLWAAFLHQQQRQSSQAQSQANASTSHRNRLAC